MKFLRCSFLVALIQGSISTVYAGFGGPVAISSLAKSADTIVVANLIRIVQGPANLDVEVQIVQTLVGSPNSTSITANVPVGRRSPSGILEPAMVGERGVWFFRQVDGKYTVLPLFQGAFSGRELFIPVSGADFASTTTGSPIHQVLVYQLRWYQSLKNPTPTQDELLLKSLHESDNEDSIDVITTMRSSVAMNLHALGLAAAIHRGSPEAVISLSDEINLLKSNPRFSKVLESVEGFPPVQTSAAVSAFQRLIQANPGISKVDVACARALVRIGNSTTGGNSSLPGKAVLPALVDLLDSTSAEARFLAIRFLTFFTTFADATGSFPGTGVMGPFATDDTKLNTPRSDSVLSVDQYAAFWKVWWAQNRAQLGY